MTISAFGVDHGGDGPYGIISKAGGVSPTVNTALRQIAQRAPQGGTPTMITDAKLASGKADLSTRAANTLHKLNGQRWPWSNESQAAFLRNFGANQLRGRPHSDIATRRVTRSSSHAPERVAKLPWP